MGMLDLRGDDDEDDGSSDDSGEDSDALCGEAPSRIEKLKLAHFEPRPTPPMQLVHFEPPKPLELKELPEYDLSLLLDEPAKMAIAVAVTPSPSKRSKTMAIAFAVTPTKSNRKMPMCIQIDDKEDADRKMPMCIKINDKDGADRTMPMFIKINDNEDADDKKDLDDAMKKPAPCAGKGKKSSQIRQTKKDQVRPR